MANFRSPHIQRDLHDLNMLKQLVAEGFDLACKFINVESGVDNEVVRSKLLEDVKLAEDFASLVQEVDSIYEATDSIKQKFEDDPSKFVRLSDEEICLYVDNCLDEIRPQCVPEQKLHSIKSLRQFILTAGQGKSNATVSDDDICVTESINSFKDPMSQAPILNPVRNIVCNHYYEKKIIVTHLDQVNNCKCPVAGCTNILQKSDLVDDLVLKAKIAIKAKQHQRNV